MNKENFENYYQILGLPDFASVEEVKKRFYEIKKHSLIRITPRVWKAYDILSNPLLKSEYDVLLKASYEAIKELNSSKVSNIKNLALYVPLLWFTFQAYILSKDMDSRLGAVLFWGLFMGGSLSIMISEIIDKFYKDSVIRKIAERTQISTEKLFSFLAEIPSFKKEILDKDLKPVLIGIPTIFILLFSIAYPESLILFGKKPISLNKAVEKYWDKISSYINGTIPIKACRGYYPNDDCYDVEADILNGDIKKIYFRNGGSLSFYASLNQNGEAQDFDKYGNLWYFSIEEPYGEYSIIREGIKLWAKDNNYVITNEGETPKEVLPAGIPEDIKNWTPEERAEFLIQYFRDLKYNKNISKEEWEKITDLLQRKNILTDDVVKIIKDKLKNEKLKN